ncbi:MAG: protein-glutamate O-methyltransferase CheR [Coriobacteriia bacterium]|nr:protein-glutamate O-methyltransferase CheR [Coriobacteriia bacterium]MBN2822010.1 protein-glutamate O-methyltransferase CheR [Coriobacteriia bacterium]
MESRQADMVYRGNLTRLLEKVRVEHGLDLSQYRERYVERRIASRLHMLGLHTYRQYAEYLDATPTEYVKLVDTLTINVTQFFRDITVYELFRKQILPDILEYKLARHQRMIRVWSAGCATGQEPYSLGMSFLTAMGTRSRDFLLSIQGTDLDHKALAIAREAVYPIEQIEHIPRADRKYVEVLGDTFRIKPEVTKLVRFQYLNLFEDKPIHVVDVIFCRNVFIYFTREEQERVLQMFWSALSRGGYLVLGRSERLATSMVGRFELVDGRERIYRKPVGMP